MSEPNTTPHYFEGIFPLLGPGPRRCKVCAVSYDDGEHIEITTLKPYTSYVCPSGESYGHSAIYTGALIHSLRNLTQHICMCGREFVEEDNERWEISWEMQSAPDVPWRPVSAIRSRHAAEQQEEGLLILIADGESIRNVRLVQLVEATS